MPSVQDEHSSEHSQAFQGLLNSDSLDDMADESPERSPLRHSGHYSLGTGHTGNRSDHEHSVHRSQSVTPDAVDHWSILLNRTLLEHRSELEHGSASNRTRHRSDVSRSSRRDSSTHRAAIPLRHADPGEHFPASLLRHRRVRSRSRPYDSVSPRRHSHSPSRSTGKKKKSHKKRKYSSTSRPSSLRSSSFSFKERVRKSHKSIRRNTLVYVLLNLTNVLRKQEEEESFSIFFLVFFSFLQTLFLLSREVQLGRSLEIVLGHFLRLMRILMIPLLGLSVRLFPGPH